MYVKTESKIHNFGAMHSRKSREKISPKLKKNNYAENGAEN